MTILVGQPMLLLQTRLGQRNHILQMELDLIFAYIKERMTREKTLKSCRGLV